MHVYINDMAVFLPNPPVSNDAIESVLGKINGFPSRARRLVLKNNGITTRYYAICPETGRPTHTNAQLAAEAVQRLRPSAGFTPKDIECLCCGTTSPDLLLPGHALMVQGELGLPPCEIMTAAGICMSGMLAFKYAYMNVAMGFSRNAVAVGSELSSSFMRSTFFSRIPQKEAAENPRPELAFDTDFLRWMLSDGAGAAFLSPDPVRDKPCLRIDWIDYIAYAGEFSTCMYAGGVKNPDGTITGWRLADQIGASERKHLMAVKQDIRHLDKNIVGTMQRALTTTIGKRGLAAGDFDWFLPHYSSAFFREKFHRAMADAGFDIPMEKWFTNLSEKGNTGAAAIYIILAELMAAGRLKTGERLLCFIPESGRFSHCFMQLTVM